MSLVYVPRACDLTALTNIAEKLDPESFERKRLECYFNTSLIFLYTSVLKGANIGDTEHLSVVRTWPRSARRKLADVFPFFRTLESLPCWLARLPVRCLIFARPRLSAIPFATPLMRSLST